MSDFSKKTFFVLISLSFLLNQNAMANQSNSGCEHFSAPSNAENLVVMERCPHNNLFIPIDAENYVILEKKPEKTFGQKSSEKIKDFGQEIFKGLKGAVRFILILSTPAILVGAFFIYMLALGCGH